MPHRATAAPQRQPRPRAAHPTGRARAAARPARPAGGGGPGRRRPAARAARARLRLVRRRAGARLSARAVRRPGSGSRAGFRCGAARPADCGRRPWGLDRAEGRVVRPGPGRARGCAGTPDPGPSTRRDCASVGARGGIAQRRARCRARRGRPADPDPQPAAAARRRGQGGDGIAAAAARRRRHAERRRHALANRGDAERCRRPGEARVRPATLAGIPGALSGRPDRQLAGRLATGGLA